ncbi:hypothetical protein [Gimesia aquarii]|uniref:ATP-grasp domain-containing protein n=1 Tax=Gimesia aquarii TaxID=2527964 RepID=A0A517W349_9PLAN|nr:hypothetical protein [Gimesia aquarii]QDT99668.1 hypothetical protein V144x_51810 [Gimesia aquarii]
MRQFFLGNFDFEHQLANEVYGTSGGAAPVLNASLASCWVSLAEDGDLISIPGKISAEFTTQLEYAGLPRVEFTNQWPSQADAASLQLVPWGWSSEMLQIAKSKGLQANAPPTAAVQTVNARTFSFQCEQEWDLLLAGSQQLENLEELESAVCALQNHQASQEASWVVKANFSMSARERIQGQGGQLTDQMRGWARKRFAQGQTLFLEPWVNRKAEAGLQFEIPSQGAPQFVGVALLRSDTHGQYRGSQITVDEQTLEEWQPAIEVGQRVARRAQQAGYFGPLGIDAMCYWDEKGKRQWRPIQDVNARHTMGRLALGFSRFLESNQAASWLHFTWKESYGVKFSNWLRCVSEQEESETRLIATAPDQIDGMMLPLVSVLVIADSVEQLKRTENHLLRAVSDLSETGC